MMKNRQLKTNKAPLMNPLALAQMGCVDVDPLARSSPKQTKLQLVKPKLEPSLITSPRSSRIIIKAEPLNMQSPSKFTPLSSSLVQMEMFSLQQNPPPFIPRSYTWTGHDGLQQNPTWKHNIPPTQYPRKSNYKPSQPTLSAKAGVAYS